MSDDFWRMSEEEEREIKLEQMRIEREREERIFAKARKMTRKAWESQSFFCFPTELLLAKLEAMNGIQFLSNKDQDILEFFDRERQKKINRRRKKVS